VHKTLALLPGQAREYGLAEFARDLYLLDSSGTVTTKAGRRISLPASTTTKVKKVLRTVTRNGQAKDTLECPSRDHRGGLPRLLRPRVSRRLCRTGRAAVKFVVADGGGREMFSAQLADRARQAGYVHCTVDAARTRVHMIDQVFFAVAGQVDFDATAAAFLRGALVELRMPMDDGDALTLAVIAERHNYDASELQRDINRVLQREVLADHGMTREFRVAMVRLCQGHLRGALGEDRKRKPSGSGCAASCGTSCGCARR
jgi:hypothetical protein